MSALKYLIFLFIPVMAFATGKEPPDEPTPQTQTQDMEQEQIQTQTFTGGANTSSAQSGDVSLQGGDVSINNRHQRSAPGVFPPSIYPSNPCTTGWSLGLSWLKGSGAVGKAKVDPECNDREWVRTAPETHKLYVFCSTDYMKEKFPSVEACLDYVPRETNDGVPPPEPATYDDAALTQQIEALVARVGAVEHETQQTEVRARRQERRLTTVSARSDPYAAMQARVEQQTEYIE